MNEPPCNDSLPPLTGGSWHNSPSAGWFYVVITDTTNPGPRQPVSNWVPRGGLISYGVLLAVLAALVNAVLCLTTLYRKQRCSIKKVTSSSSSSSSWRRLALVNFTCVQLAVGLIVVPVKVMTETMAVWTIGPTACRIYLLGQVWLIAETMWSVVLLVFDALIQSASATSQRYSEYSRDRPRCIAPAAVIVSWLAASTALFPLGVALTNNGDTNDAVLEEVCAISMRRNDAVAQAVTSFLLPAAVALCGCAALVCKSVAKGNSSSEGCWMSPVAVAVASCALWSPFFALYAALPFCPYDRMCVDPGAWTVLAWLGYSTSFVAPLCWLVCDKEFRARSLRFIKPMLIRHSGSSPDALGGDVEVKSGDEADEPDHDVMTSVKGTSSERLVVGL